MYTHNLDPIIIDFGFIALRWYSLAYIFGIVIGWWYGKRIIIEKFKLPLGISKDEVYKRIKFLYSQKDKIKYSQKNEPIQPSSNFQELNSIEKEYCSLDFIENPKLQYYEFFSIINKKFPFRLIV